MIEVTFARISGRVMVAALKLRISGGCAPGGNCRSAVWETAVTWALALSRLALRGYRDALPPHNGKAEAVWDSVLLRPAFDNSPSPPRRLGLGSTQPDAYPEEEIRFLTLVADQVALAIDDALNFEAAQLAHAE
jgi:hypothetical protein